MKLITSLMIVLFCAMVSAQNPTATTATTASIGASQALGTLAVSRNSNYSVVTAVDVSAPSAGAFTCAASDICTKATHGFYTGLKVAITTSAADLPSPLTETDYYVIALTTNTFSLATTPAAALLGTAVDIVDAGTGTHTATPAALSGASVKLQGSMDGTNWVDLPIKATGDATKSGTITVDGNFFLGEAALNINYVRVYYTLAAGQFSVSQIAKVQKYPIVP